MILFVPHNTLHSVFAVSSHSSQIFVEYLVFTVIKIIDKEKFKFLGDRFKHHF